MNFEFATSQRIIFGNGCSEQIFGIIQNFGKKILLITGKHNELDNPIRNQKKLIENCEIIQVVCDKEPGTMFIEKKLKELKRFSPDVVVSIGGGSVIDTGKALAILISNDGELLDYLEVIGKGTPLQKESIPFIAIPTTAGTGSEVTRNAVIYDEASGVKVSLRSALMLPKAAIIDPILAVGLPPEVTASTGMDAITQVIEPLITRKANPLSDAICLHAVSIAKNALLKAYRDPSNADAREEMALVSLIGGLALANSGLGVVHGFAAAIGGMYHAIGHGLICGILLPASFQVNRLKCEYIPEYKAVSQKFAKISSLLGGNDAISGDKILQELKDQLEIPGLGQLGIQRSDYPEIIDKTLNSSSMKGNPIELSREDLLHILEMSY